MNSGLVASVGVQYIGFRVNRQETVLAIGDCGPISQDRTIVPSATYLEAETMQKRANFEIATVSALGL